MAQAGDNISVNYTGWLWENGAKGEEFDSSTKTGRPFRFCQPRDLLLQVKNHCAYHKTPMVLTNEAFDLACENYFAVM